MSIMSELKQFTKWTGFIAVFTIIFGALQAVGGLFAFIIGALPGVLMIILGIKLLKAKRQADEMLEYDVIDEDRMKALFNNLNIYFKIQGVLIIISLIFTVIGLIAMFTLGFSMFDTFSQF